MPQALLEALVQFEISESYFPAATVSENLLDSLWGSLSHCLMKVSLKTSPVAAPATGLIEV